jgi:hypothetical protein
MKIMAGIEALWRPVANWFQDDKMRRPGIANGMRLAGAYNQFRYGRHDRWRRWLYENQLDELLAENGPAESPVVELPDGWGIDTSMSLPHLDRVLEDADRIIAERGGHRQTGYLKRRSFFQDVWTPEDTLNYPSILDFATSTDVLAAVSQYLKCIPALSTHLPAGIRLVESNAAFDDQPDRPHESQLFHIDFYARPNVYVLVLLRDTTVEMGPFTFLPRAASERAKQALGYWNRGVPYYLSDDRFYSVVDRKDVIEFSYPRGTVLFIESSGCFHYGSRNAVKPRFQLMLGYTSACRTDFSEVIHRPRTYPTCERDSLLRQLVCNKYMEPPRGYAAGRVEPIREESSSESLAGHAGTSENWK